MPKITSLLDNDFYQFTMGYYIWKYYSIHEVEYRFRNRTFEVPLADCINLDVLQEELDYLSTLRFAPDEIDYLDSLGIFDSYYLTWLSEEYEGVPIFVDNHNGHLVLNYRGPWQCGIFFETPILATVNEMYYERYAATLVEGTRRLDAKITNLQAHPHLQFVEFGTRRRFSGRWQRIVLTELKHRLTPQQLLGTSNVLLARDLELVPSGTMAHQLFMAVTALFLENTPVPGFPAIAAATQEVADDWLKLYADKPHILTMLPDTYGSMQCLDFLSPASLKEFRGVRQDSGDPVTFGENLLDLYKTRGINPQEHLLFFSDSLDLRTIHLLYDRFHDRIPVAFGWGTNLTNDIGFESLSLVIKPDAVDGLQCVKLSDDFAKATGDINAVAWYKDVLNEALLSRGL